MTRVGVNGAAGRMGRTLIEAIGESDDLSLTAAFEHPDSDALGTEVAGVRIGPDVAAGVADFDVLIDFTEPSATLDALEPCEARGGGWLSARRVSTRRVSTASGPRPPMCPS